MKEKLFLQPRTKRGEEERMRSLDHDRCIWSPQVCYPRQIRRRNKASTDEGTEEGIGQVQSLDLIHFSLGFLEFLLPLSIIVRSKGVRLGQSFLFGRLTEKAFVGEVNEWTYNPSNNLHLDGVHQLKHQTGQTSDESIRPSKPWSHDRHR